MSERALAGAAASNGEPLPEQQQMIVEKIRSGFSLYECAPMLGVTYQTAYGWLQRYPDFAVAVAKAAAEYEERLLKPVNALIDRYDEDEFVVPAARMAVTVLSRRFPHWREKAEITQDVVHHTPEHAPASDWSTPERVRATFQIYKELGLDQIAQDQPRPQPEPPATEVVRQRAPAIPVVYNGGHEHIAANRETRNTCVKCRVTFSVPLPVWGDQPSS
jgi:hypothetical protein